MNEDALSPRDVARDRELLAAHGYTVVRRLGVGGVGVVYEALHEPLGRRVAVKVLYDFEDVGSFDRFRREAKVTAALHHPHIVQVTEFHDRAGSTPFLVMEYLEGRTLSEVIERDGPLAPGRVVAIGLQVLSALATAHRAGIIHRDIKPDNIFVTSPPALPDFVKVLDFGIAKEVMSQSQSAERGTPDYMSPEHVAGEPLDGRTDVYAVGATMYHALTGRPPFRADNMPALLAAILSKPPRPLLELAPGTDPALVGVVERALCKHPGERFPSADAMAAALAF